MPARYGKPHTADAVFLLALIAILMAADGMFSAAVAVGQLKVGEAGEQLAFLSLPWLLQIALGSASLPAIGKCCFGAYLVHETAFYFLLCYRPFGIQFHVETSLFNVYFAKLNRGTVKPVRWDIPDAASGPGQNPRSEDLRRLHLEAHARLLFLRRLWPLL